MVLIGHQFEIDHNIRDAMFLTGHSKGFVCETDKAPGICSTSHVRMGDRGPEGQGPHQQHSILCPHHKLGE